MVLRTPRRVFQRQKHATRAAWEPALVKYR